MYDHVTGRLHVRGMSEFEDVLRTIKRRLEGRLRLRGVPVPVTFYRPDPDRLKEERPILVIRWLDLLRNRARDRREITEVIDEAAGIGRRIPSAARYDMLIQFDLLTGNMLDDLLGYAQLMQVLEQIAARQEASETLGALMEWRYDSDFRDESDRDFMSACRYVVTTEMSREWLAEEGALVKAITMRMYDGLSGSLREDVTITDE